jgi:hypothetical protein
LTRARSARIAIVALLALLTTVLAGCLGFGDGSEDPQEVLDQTFSNETPISSAHLNISLAGSAGDSGSLSATLDGAFQGDPDDTTAPPQLDLSATVDGTAAGQSLNFDGGVVATEDNAFVEYQGQAYEIGPKAFAQFKRAYIRSAQASEATEAGDSSADIFAQLGIDPSDWLSNLSNEGDEDVEGTETVHIHGDADIAKIVSDLGTISEQVPNAPPLGQAELDQVASAVQDASIDVYSGKDDRLLRKLSLSLTIEPPASAGTPVTSVDVDFSMTFSDVNEPQTIAAPSSARPFRDLADQLGLGGLPGVGGLPGLGGGAGGVGGGGPGEDYLSCIEKAQTAEDYNKCAESLQ